MAITADYLKAIQNQKKLISELGNSSSPKIPGLSVDAVVEKLAEMDENLTKTSEYYRTQAEVLAGQAEQEAASAGINETPEQKKARLDREKAEAEKKISGIVTDYANKQKDFVQEQISIIQTSYSLIIQETATLGKRITLAISTSLQPAAIGAASPNPVYNLGVLYQQLSSAKSSLDIVSGAFLNMLIAADKIKFALPSSVTELLQKILDIKKTILGKQPIESDITPAPIGTLSTLKSDEYKKLGETSVIVTAASNRYSAKPGQIGDIVSKGNDGQVTIKITK